MRKNTIIPAADNTDKAEAQTIYHRYCEKCGWIWYSTRMDDICPSPTHANGPCYRG